MVLGVLSDTHDKLPQLEAALVFFRNQNVDAVVHCGDWKNLSTVAYCQERAQALALPLYGVLGNNDTDVPAFLEYAAGASENFNLEAGVLSLHLAGKSIAVYHGHHSPTRRHLLADPTYDVVLLGHTHKPLITTETNRLIVNPGSTAFAIPRSKSWQPSVAVVDLTGMTATIEYLSY